MTLAASRLGTVQGRHLLGRGWDPCRLSPTLSTRLPADEPPDAFVERCADIGTLGIDQVVALTDGPFDDRDPTCLTTAAHARLNHDDLRGGRRCTQRPPNARSAT